MEMKQAKSYIFPWNIFKSDVRGFFYQKILKYFNDLQNQCFSIFLFFFHCKSKHKPVK